MFLKPLLNIQLDFLLVQKNHENSNEHKNVVTRKERKSVLDKQLDQQLRHETEYYRNALKRVLAVITFLSIRILAFRGSEEVFGSPHNGNFIIKNMYL